MVVKIKYTHTTIQSSPKILFYYQVVRETIPGCFISISPFIMAFPNEGTFRTHKYGAPSTVATADICGFPFTNSGTLLLKLK